MTFEFVKLKKRQKIKKLKLEIYELHDELHELEILNIIKLKIYGESIYNLHSANEGK